MENNIYDYVILLGGLNDLADIMINMKKTDDVINSFRNIYELLQNNIYIKKFIHITIPYCILDCKNNGDNKYLKSKDIINGNICNMYNSKKLILDLRDHENYQLNCLYLNEKQRIFYWDDNIHFTKEGYMLLAKNIYNFFKKEILLNIDSEFICST